MNKYLQYLINAKNYTSILKAVPLNDENLDFTKWLVKLIYKGKKVKVRYRGKRYHHAYHTLKSEASHFYIYVIIKV